MIVCGGHLHEFENLLLSVGEFRRKDDRVLARGDLVSFHVPKQSNDIEDGRSRTRSALGINGNGSEFLYGGSRIVNDRHGKSKWKGDDRIASLHAVVVKKALPRRRRARELPARTDGDSIQEDKVWHKDKERSNYNTLNEKGW